MSIERALLRKLFESGMLDRLLAIEVGQLLAQPEEGVYQRLLRIEDGIEVEILPSELWMDGYETGRKDPQKREPLGKEIKVPCGSTEYMFGFKDGVLYAEKEHGIGVNNEKI